MAKTIKRIINIALTPDATGVVLEKCVVTYEAGSTDDDSLSKIAVVEVTLAGADLTATEELFLLCLNSAETEEGI